MRLVFVSSTFKDMQFERDALKVRVAPRIDAFLAKYGENVHFGDLRWGVNTSELESEESSKKVLKVCLDEIDNCHPYMIVFIGERYGWIPSSELLEETMAMKGIENIPSDISVTNLEIEYGALLNPDFEGRVLFYFRNPIDTSEMSEEERKIYEAESPLHKEKLENLKKVIEEKYPNYIRHYDAIYDKKSGTLQGLDGLMDQINDDLKRIFDLDLSRLNSLPSEVRASENAHAFFERYYKNAYMRKEAILHEWSDDYDDLMYADEEELPMVEMIYGREGSGRKTLLALKYKKSLELEDVLTIPFVYDLDEFSDSEDKFVATLIYKIEEKLGKEFTHSSSLEYLAELFDEDIVINIFVANAQAPILRTITLLQSYKPVWYYITFYLEDDDLRDLGWYLPQLPFNLKCEVPYLEDSEKELLIKAIAQSRHKEISKPVITSIIEKNDSNIPLYLSLIVERLLMLDHEDFQNIRNLGDGMEAINNYMLQIVNKSGSNIKDIAKDLLKEIIERTNPAMALKLVAVTTLKNHLNKAAIEELFNYYGWTFNDLDYSLFRHLIPSLFSISADGDDMFWFKNDEIVEAAKELIASYNEDNHLDDIIKWIEAYPISEKTEKFIYKCKAIFYREKGEVSKFVDNYLSIIDEESFDSLDGYSKEYWSRVSKYASLFIGQLNKSYIHHEDFYDLVDDEIVKRLSEGKVKNPLVLLNLYYNYYVNEKHSYSESMDFNYHHSELTKKMIDAYEENPNNQVLKDFAMFYSFLIVGMDFNTIEMMDDVELLELVQSIYHFANENKANQYVQNMKNQNKLLIKTMTSSIFDAYTSFYNMVKDNDDEDSRASLLKAIDFAMIKIPNDSRVGPIFAKAMNGEEVVIENRDKAYFGALPLMFMYAADIAYKLNLDSYKTYFDQATKTLRCFLNNLDTEDLIEETNFSGVTEIVKCICDFVDSTKEELDKDLIDLINNKMKIYHAYHPADFKAIIAGIIFASNVEGNESSYEVFRYYLPAAYNYLLNLPKNSRDDIYAVIFSLGIYRGVDMGEYLADYYANRILFNAFDKDSSNPETLELLFDMVYYYVDDWSKTKLKDEFFLELVDDISTMYENPHKMKKLLLDEAKKYIKEYVE